MSQGTAAVRLAVRQLWISFRLLVLVVAFAASGLLAALPSAVPGMVHGLLAVGFGVATAVTAAVAAWSLADDRIRGHVGWLVTRSVPRPTIIGAWFLGIALVTLPALAAAAILGWLAASVPGTGADPMRFAASMLGMAGLLLAAIAAGLLAGIVLRPVLAAAVAALTAAAASLAPLVMRDPPAVFPSAAVAAGAGAAGSESLIGLGATLVTCAAVLGIARLVIERVDL